MNEPLHSAAANAEYRLLDVNRSGGAESALVLVALSGGGKRSAAFAFGVLRGMADTPVRPNGANSILLDEIDMLSGVSGGSFPPPISPFMAGGLGTGIGFSIRSPAPTTG